jgi:hypothetical protein
MTPKERLINIFERIHQVYEKLDARYHDENIAQLVKDMNSGAFFDGSEDSQISTLGWFDKALLGRGEGLYGILDAGLLPSDFPDEMRLAYMMYYLTLNCFDEEHKDRLRKRITDILNK